MRTLSFLGLGAVVLTTVAAIQRPATSTARWSAEEREVIGSLRLSTLGAVPADPSNRVADDPAAVRLGQQLFFDTRLSSNGQVACATCHQPQKEFQDGTPLGHGVGTTGRRTMPIAGTQWSPWQFWDGRKDSQWAQALGPLESPVEHGGNRAMYAQVIARHYRRSYEALFGAIPASAGTPGDTATTRVFVNIGKAIAAYERKLRPGTTRFDRYADTVALTGRAPTGILTADEEEGLRLFVGKAQCVTCHNGPRFTDDHFHNTATPVAAGLPLDHGRAVGAAQVRADEFNCLSRWSDAPASACRELNFMEEDGPQLEHAFKTPSLRGVAERAPYMHAGQFADLEQVVAHYNDTPRAPSGKSELRSIRLNATERGQLVAFLRALSAPLDTPSALLQAPR
ncbi:MAG TPA: cytochrome c peroxidase [Gemmatimonadales bacterium]|nr:cytochrome c peroxidase [Gemmatimonadales bacterium]